jgi:hypothetical protein
MSKEEEICCSNCGIICDQTLLLSCDHNLCMNCAANNLVRNESPGMNKTQYIICDICQQKTEIDTNTSKEVLSLGLNRLNKNDIEVEDNLNYQNINEFENNYYNSSPENNLGFNTQNSLMNSNNDNVNLTSPVNLVYFSNTKNNINNLSEKYDINDIKSNIHNNSICKDHGEPITYLCLDCMSKCICSECVVHGIHRNHEVLNIKKAYPLIYSKTQEIGNHISSKIKELYNTQKKIEQKKKEINTLNNKCRIDIRQAFDELRSLLNKKEKEIMDKTENTLNDNINELNTYNHIIQSKLILLNKLIETVNVYLMRKNELNLINFYTENKNKILAQTELNEIENINNLNLEEMSNLKINIDKSSFDAMISAINTLNFEIDTLRGNHNLGKFTANRNLYGNNSVKENLENLIDEKENIQEKKETKKKNKK